MTRCSPLIYCVVALLLLITWADITAAQDDQVLPEPTVIPAQPHALGNAESVAFSPDGVLVAAGFGGASSGRFPLKPTDGGVAVWETATGKRILLAGEYGDIVRLEFSNDGKSLHYGRVYTPGDSVDFDAVVLLDVAGGKVLKQWDRGYVGAASPTASRVVVAQGTGICHAYDLNRLDAEEDAREVIMENARHAQCLAFSPDGTVFAAVHEVLEPFVRSDGTINPTARAIRLKGLAVFDAATLAVRQTTLNDELPTCTALSVSPGGTLLATGHKDGVVRVWGGAPLAEKRKLDVASASYACPVFSPDGKLLAVLTQPANSPTWRYAPTPSGFEYGRQQQGTTCELVFYDTQTFQPVRRWHFEDGTFRTWHANGHRASLNPRRLAFSPDGKHVLIGCDGVLLIEVETGKIVRQFDVQLGDGR